MQNAACGMSEYSQLVVIGPRGAAQHLPPEIEVKEAPSDLLRFMLVSMFLAVSTCRQSRFDLAIGGSGLVAPTLFLLKLLFGQTTAVLIHGLDIVIDNTLYQRLFVPCIKRMDCVIANSSNTRTLAIEKGVLDEKIDVVNPGTTLPEVNSEQSIVKFRSDKNITFQKYLVFVGRMTKRKGVSAFLQNCMPHILNASPDTGLVVVGGEPQDSLNQLGEQSEIMSTIGALGLKEHVLFLGQISDQELELCYAGAAVQIFPLIEVPGDIEGFGMVAVEAAACGTPTIAFDLGGVADAISNANGHLITPNNYEAFGQTVVNVITSGQPDAASCRNHAQNFSWSRYNKKLRASLQPLWDS